jgi:large subunit ribosomal protein L23
MEIILKPIITEKATNDSELRNRYTFLVRKAANKVEIKNAVQKKYNVTVEKVRTQIYGPERNPKNSKIAIPRTWLKNFSVFQYKIPKNTKISLPRTLV